MTMHNLRILLLALCLTTAAATASPAQQACRGFAPGEVQLLPSRFTENRTRDSLWIESIPTASLLHSWRNTAGVYSGYEGGYDTIQKLGGWESLDCDIRGHTMGHLLSAMARLGMREKSDSLVSGLAEVQAQYGTGYLSAFGEGLIDRLIAGKQVWVPFYTLHKVLQGLLDQYTILGNEQALRLARGMGDWAYAKLSPLDEATRRRMLRTEFGGFNEAMYNLYALTGDERHLWVARFFYHDERIDPLKQGDTKLGRNHANTFIPKLLGECRNYEMTGAEDSRRAAENFFGTITRRHAFVTGEISEKEHLFDPDTQSKQLHGLEGENCCTYNLLKLADRLFSYEPRAWIADYYERALYNHILGQQDPSTSMVCYYTPLKTGAWRLYSTPLRSFWCCVGSGFEGPSRYPDGIYYHSGDSLYVNLFIPSSVNWHGSHITQHSEMPDVGRTSITIEGNRDFTLMIRCPWWCTWMKVNGRRVKASPSSYLAIRRPKARTVVEFGMELREVPTIDDPSRVALMYGPIVLGGRLEEVSNPFSDPGKHNDYYDFDYGTYPDVCYGSIDEFTHEGGLKFRSPDGISVEPLYDLHHCRYVVYWQKSADADALAQSGDWDCTVSLRGYVSRETGQAPQAHIWIPEGCTRIRAAVLAQQNMTEEAILRSPLLRSRIAPLGVALIWVSPWFTYDWAPESGCAQIFESMMNDAAATTGHPELGAVPIVPLGHSAQATFPWNFAAWQPERTLCVISFHGDAPRTNLCGYGGPNLEWGRKRNIDGIPGLMIEGEYEWWEARVRPALSFRMKYPGSCISFLADAGAGHFDCPDETLEYMAKFIAKSLDARQGPDGALRPVDPLSGWLACRYTPDSKPSDGDGVDTDIFCVEPRPQPAPFESYAGDRHDAFWYFDGEMALEAEKRYAATLGKTPQTVGILYEGKLIPYDATLQGGMELKLPEGTTSFCLEAVCTDAGREGIIPAHGNLHIDYISGACRKISDGTAQTQSSGDTFQVLRPDGRHANLRRDGVIWLAAVADGDSTHKRAVQPIKVIMSK